MNTNATLFALLFGFVPVAASAGPILAEGAYPGLDAAIERHERQFYHFNALPFGLSLDTAAKSASELEAITAYLSDPGAGPPEAGLGAHPFTLLSTYGEHGDLGMFAGVALAATAFRYRVLKRDGAPPDVLAEARARVVRAVESWHVCYEVTGGGGVVARGIRRVQPEDPSAPPIPGQVPALIPLFDGDGAPLPQPKDNGTYRADNSGGSLPAGQWVWKDSASKDQVVGQVFGMVALYDAIVDDPDIDPTLVERMQADALGLAQVLMTPREISELEGPVGSGVYDLIIMDADGRPTYHHDLHPLSLEKFYLTSPSAQYNVFNVLMALGILQGLYHIAGDAELEAFLYEELMGARGYLELAKVADPDAALDYVLIGEHTNFSNVNMIATALWLGIHLQPDPEVAGVFRDYLEDRWWAREGESRAVKLCKQPFFHAVYMGLTDRGVAPELGLELADLLAGFALGPYLNTPVTNCDAAELAAGKCTAIDGKTVLTLVPGTVEGGNATATEALHPSIRPPSNFDARSDPFRVNGGGGLRLNPGGDLLAAYWMARWFSAAAPGGAQTSPYARDHMPVGGWPPEPPADDPPLQPPDSGPPPVAEPPPDSGPPPADMGAASPPSPPATDSGGCALGRAPGSSTPWALALLFGVACVVSAIRRRALG